MSQWPPVRMMAMQGSSSEDSYALQSSPQNYNFHMFAKPRLAIALDHVVRNFLRTREAASSAVADTGLQDGLLTQQRPRIAIADVGCAHGRNTLDCAEFVLDTLQRNWLPCEDDATDDDSETHDRCGSTGNEEGKEVQRVSCDDEMEIQYFFSDLPSNDFNALFQSLQPYLYQSNGAVCTGEDHRALPKIFAAGVPGSCYGRLFPSSSLHLVICSYTLHWLSRVPSSVLDRSSSAWNGEHTWINKASASAKEAYAQQFNIDMKNFLKSRVHELAHGGVMFLFIAARSLERDYLSGHLGFIPIGSTFELFDFAFKELVDEGVLSLEEMEMFNVPMYMFDQQELESILLDVPELDVLHMETMENMALVQEQKDRVHVVQLWAGLISSVMRPLLETQLGKWKADEVLKRIKNIATKLDCFNTTVTNDLVIACLQRQIREKNSSISSH